MGTRNVWTDRELALLKELARAHIAGGGVIDETFARSVERRIPRHPWSGVVRKLHTLGYRARTGMAETTNAAVPARKETNEERTLTDAVERLISALEGFRRAVARQA